MRSNADIIQVAGQATIKAWVKGVSFDPNARRQVLNMAQMPFIHPWIAVMPDVHLGKGATIGSVIPTLDAVIPAAVGVDIGCGMMAAKTNLMAAQLPDALTALRHEIERNVPHGGGPKMRGHRDKGAWANTPADVERAWLSLDAGFNALCDKHPFLKNTNNVSHLGTLGSGNHFIEICIDETQQVWVMLHSGSRGVGNRIGTHFIEQAKRDMERHSIKLPDQDLAYLREGSEHFHDYVEAVAWAQDFAKANRALMMQRTLTAMSDVLKRPIIAEVEAINCHHNYIRLEHHYGQDLWVTRKGAVSARKGELGIIPGSMGTRSFIVRGLGNAESFCSCSHGAGRVMSRTEAKKRVSMADHLLAVQGVECRQDASVLDETPAAYKPIEQVMAAQDDLVEIVHTLKQVLCVKG